MLFQKFPITALFPEILLKYFDNDAKLETFLKESNERVIKVNQIMSYIKCRLSQLHTYTQQEKVGKK